MTDKPEPDNDWPSKWFLVALVFMVAFLVAFLVADKNHVAMHEYVTEMEAPKWPF